jgi:hypothetical protein
MTTHEEWYAGSPGSRTVSSSDYHAKCTGCVEREKRIADLEARWTEREACYRKWGVLPCPSCQAANERIADLERELAAFQNAAGA